MEVRRRRVPTVMHRCPAHAAVSHTHAHNTGAYSHTCTHAHRRVLSRSLSHTHALCVPATRGCSSSTTRGETVPPSSAASSACTRRTVSSAILALACASETSASPRGRGGQGAQGAYRGELTGLASGQVRRQNVAQLGLCLWPWRGGFRPGTCRTQRQSVARRGQPGRITPPCTAAAVAVAVAAAAPPRKKSSGGGSLYMPVLVVARGAPAPARTGGGASTGGGGGRGRPAMTRNMAATAVARKRSRPNEEDSDDEESAATVRHGGPRGGRH
jgi:hypothetical protein